PPAVLAAAFAGEVSNLDQMIAACLVTPPRAQRLLLIVDQFEQIFALGKTDPTSQRRFIATLKALRELDSCVVITALRADFFGDLMNSELWGNVALAERLEVTTLQGDALRAAIREPAAQEGVEIESGLIERLLADAGNQPGSLPL